VKTSGQKQGEGQDDDVLDLQGKWMKLAQDRVRWRSAHSGSADRQQQWWGGMVKLASSCSLLYWLILCSMLRDCIMVCVLSLWAEGLHYGV
jgi:hypothetical protein